MKENIKMETQSGIVAEMTNEGVIYRHYLITKHAIERYIERVRNTVDELFVSIDRSVIADAQQAKDHRVQQQIRRSESDGGYALLDPETNTYYFLAIGKGRFHVICTVMTLELLTYAGR